MSTESTAPAWYDGSTPWAELAPAAQLWEVVTAGRGPTAEEIELTGYSVIDPDRNLRAVVAVVDFAGRNGHLAELATGINWLVEYGFLMGPVAGEQE